MNSGGQASTSVPKSLRAWMEKRQQKMLKDDSFYTLTDLGYIINIHSRFICSIALLTLSHFILRTARPTIATDFEERKLRHKQLNGLTQRVKVDTTYPDQAPK